MKSKIIWQSKRFPKLFLTEEHLTFLKEMFPTIRYFQPHFRDMELWLDGHPERVPKNHWRRFINNWFRNEIKFSQQKKERTSLEFNARPPQYGDAARNIPHDPRALGDILQRAQQIQKHEQQ